MRQVLLTAGACITAMMVCEASLIGAQVTYQFTTTVQVLNSGANGFPAVLMGIPLGSPVTGTFSYDTASPAIVNPFEPPSPSALGTLYALNNATFSFNINGVILDTWNGDSHALVWNDDELVIGNLRDALVYSNFFATSPNLRYWVGSFPMPASTFDSEALPSGNVTGNHRLEIQGDGGVLYLRTNTWQNLTVVITPCVPDIAPPGGDSTVGVPDLLAVINAWGACVDCDADIAPPGGDGTVGVPDLLAVINGWGPCQ